METSYSHFPILISSRYIFSEENLFVGGTEFSED